MTNEDPLGEAIESARIARESDEREAELRRAEAERKTAEQDAADERRRRQLQELGASFVQRARAMAVPPESVDVRVGNRDRIKGFFKQRKVGVQAIYERRYAWTVLPYHPGGSYDAPSPGIYVLDDGRIVGSISDINSLPNGSLKQVTEALARYLVAEERR